MKWDDRAFTVVPAADAPVKPSALRGAVPERFDITSLVLEATGTAGFEKETLKFKSAAGAFAVTVKKVKDEEQQKKLQATYDAFVAAVKDGAKKVKIAGDASDESVALASFSVVKEPE